MLRWKFIVVLLVYALSVNLVQSNKGHGSQGQNGVSDGHRLITRALWRIFDALMEKKNHEELYGRMKVVENAIGDMMTTDGNLDHKIDALQVTVNSYNEELSTFKKEIDKIKDLQQRVTDIEFYQLRLENQRDEGLGVAEFAKAGFSQCPEPYTAVGGMCIYVVADKKLGWREARRHCAKTGGDLTSPRELGLLRDYLASIPSNHRPEYVWVGGSRTVDDTWIWATGNQAGRSMDMSQETWNEELPEGIGDCLGLFERAGYRAYDYTCAEEDNFVCQYFF